MVLKRNVVGGRPTGPMYGSQLRPLSGRHLLALHIYTFQMSTMGHNHWYFYFWLEEFDGLKKGCRAHLMVGPIALTRSESKIVVIRPQAFLCWIFRDITYVITRNHSIWLCLWLLGASRPNVAAGC